MFFLLAFANVLLISSLDRVWKSRDINLIESC